MHPRVEKWYPFGGAVILAVAAGLAIRQWGLPPSAKDLLTAYVSTSGILVGFLATAKAILLSMDSSRIVRRLKKQKAYHKLVGYLVWAIYSGLTLAVLSSAGAVIDWKVCASWHLKFAVLWSFVAAHCGLATFRVIHLFKVLMIANAECQD